MNNDGQELHEAPVLSKDGAALLSRVVSRHRTSSAQAHEQRRKRDPLRQVPVPVEIGSTYRTASTPQAKRERSNTPRPLLVLAAMMFVGVLATGLGALLVATGDTNDSDVQTQVAGVTEESDQLALGGNAGTESTAATSTTRQVVTSESEQTAPAAIEGVDDLATTVEPTGVLPLGLELAVYDVDPINEGTRSFAIRISNLGDEPVRSVDEFSIEVELESGERLPAFVRFIHQEIPSGSSAIATVRVEGVPDGPSSAVLLFDGRELEEQQLP